MPLVAMSYSLRRGPSTPLRLSARAIRPSSRLAPTAVPPARKVRRDRAATGITYFVFVCMCPPPPRFDCGHAQRKSGADLAAQVVLHAFKTFRYQTPARHDTSQRHGADHRAENDDGGAACFLSVRRVARERDKELLEDLSRRGLCLLPGPGHLAPQGGEGADGDGGVAVGFR